MKHLNKMGSKTLTSSRGIPMPTILRCWKTKSLKRSETSLGKCLDLSKNVSPTWVIGENVSGYIKLGLDTVISDLESEGYSTRTFNIPSNGVGASTKDNEYGLFNSPTNMDHIKRKGMRESMTGRKTGRNGNDGRINQKW